MNQVEFGLSWTGIEPPLAKASSLIVARTSEWITTPSTATVPTGPPGRRVPTPKRRISIRRVLAWSPAEPLAGSAALAASAPDRARADRGLWPRGARPGEVALARELVLVRL